MHIQTAGTNIRSAISSLQTLRTQTADSAILTYAANLETFLSAKLLTIEATLTHLESKCGVTRPDITSTVSITSTGITAAVTTFGTNQDTTSNQVQTTSTIQSTTPPSLGGCSNIQPS